jgi:hypothetical protein
MIIFQNVGPGQHEFQWDGGQTFWSLFPFANGSVALEWQDDFGVWRTAATFSGQTTTGRSPAGTYRFVVSSPDTAVSLAARHIPQ